MMYGTRYPFPSKHFTPERIAELQGMLDSLGLFPTGRFKIGPPNIVCKSGKELIGLYHEKPVPGMGTTIVFERNLEASSDLFSKEEFTDQFTTATLHYLDKKDQSTENLIP